MRTAPRVSSRSGGDDARQAPALIDTLIAAGHVREEYREMADVLRTALEP